VEQVEALSKRLETEDAQVVAAAVEGIREVLVMDLADWIGAAMPEARELQGFAESALEALRAFEPLVKEDGPVAARDGLSYLRQMAPRLLELALEARSRDSIIDEARKQEELAREGARRLNKLRVKLPVPGELERMAKDLESQAHYCRLWGRKLRRARGEQPAAVRGAVG